MMFYTEVQSRGADEAEKPFWISYADLMTALMILFLVVMVTAISFVASRAEQLEVIAKTTPEIQRPMLEKLREQEISSICDQLSTATRNTAPGAKVDCKLNRISFGEAGRFATDQYRLGQEGELILAEVVPLILNTANSTQGKKWLKQVLIEGYTDTDGSYLYNLNLSLKRSEWVMCTLLRNDISNALQLTAEQRSQIKQLFLAGGVSFNDMRDSKEASRRVELRLQFYGVDERAAQSPAYAAKFDDVRSERCMI